MSPSACYLSPLLSLTRSGRVAPNPLFHPALSPSDDQPTGVCAREIATRNIETGTAVVPPPDGTIEPP
jgi:hypothetical protein